ncbi:MAG: hypothetical protein ABTD50_09445 [Polyangiaceae bacterium]|jgi:hypothetical protein
MRLLATLGALALLLVAIQARSEGRATVVVWPTLTPAGDAPTNVPLHKPQPLDKEVYELAQQLDVTLRDAVQDLGFTLSLGDTEPSAQSPRDENLLDRAARSEVGGRDEGTWVVSPRVERAGRDQYIVRIVAAAPRSKELRVRVQTVANELVSVRGLAMLRDLLSPQTAAQAALEDRRDLSARGSEQGVAKPLRSAGRAILAVNSALFGGFTAFALQRASGSDDPRVLYPLLAVGTGMGLGGALLVADEWDVSTGDAWTLAAGGWWSAVAGYLLASGQNLQPTGDRFSWATGGGLIGAGVATVALTQTPMDDGDATLVHSGAALGLLVGGAGEWMVRGKTTDIAETAPNTGMGVGTAVGLAAAGVLATRVATTPSRVLLIDVGAGGGALLGAAAASPLIFNNDRSGPVRAWLAVSLASSVVGGGVAWWLTRDALPGTAPAKGLLPWLPGRPLVGVLGMSPAHGGYMPIYGVGWQGTD